MWQIRPTDQYAKDQQWYDKKRPDELVAVTSNLTRYLSQLNVARNPLCVQGGYIHPEGAGVVALDESAGGANLQATRLYLFAHTPTRTVHLITIGNKDSQQSDVNLCHQFIEKFFPTPK